MEEIEDGYPELSDEDSDEDKKDDDSDYKDSDEDKKDDDSNYKKVNKTRNENTLKLVLRNDKRKVKDDTAEKLDPAIKLDRTKTSKKNVKLTGKPSEKITSKNKNQIIDLQSENNNNDNDDITMKDEEEEGKEEEGDDLVEKKEKIRTNRPYDQRLKDMKIAGKAKKIAEEAKKLNLNVIPIPVKEKLVEQTNYKGTNKNKEMITTDNIEDKNNNGVTPVKPVKLAYETEFNTANGMPISITRSETLSTTTSTLRSTPSCTVLFLLYR